LPSIKDIRLIGDPKIGNYGYHIFGIQCIVNSRNLSTIRIPYRLIDNQCDYQIPGDKSIESSSIY
jgi:hypothetical protein